MTTSALRLAIVTGRYWPQVGDAELFAARLAEELQASGHLPQVVAARWAAHWPERIQVREVDVHRLSHAPRGGWQTLRYMMQLARWLRRPEASFDAVYVIGLRQEAYTAVSALQRARIPVILRCHDSGPYGDCAWQATSRFGDRMRRRCWQADGVFATTPSAAGELIRLGYSRDRIHLDPGGAPTAPGRTADRRYRARAALAEAQHDLSAAEYAPVVVSVGRLDSMSAFEPLLRAWRDIAARWPSARLWLIGDGAARDALYEQIVAWDLRYQVYMPGSFEDLDDLWMAADMFVSPLPQLGRQLMLEAMAAGLPVIAADCAEVREVVEPSHHGLLVAGGDPDQWRSAISYFCEHPHAAVSLGKSAQQRVEQKFALRHSYSRHVELLQRLVHVQQQDRESA